MKTSVAFINCLLLCLVCSMSAFAASQMVYTTPSGKRYHLETCAVLKNAKEVKTLSVAEAQKKYSPCKRCKPDMMGISAPAPASTPTAADTAGSASSPPASSTSPASPVPPAPVEAKQ